MSDTHETIADIIAEKRRRAEEIERDCAEKMKRGEMISDQYARELVEDIRREADRLDAAAKRMEWTHKKELETRDAVIQTEVAAREAERESHKREMKKTVRLVSRVAEEMTRGTGKGVAPTRKEVDEWAVRLFDTIDITLGAPARNCDRFNSGNAERDAEMAWDAITCGINLQISDLTDREIAIIKEAMRGFVWLFAKADESADAGMSVKIRNPERRCKICGGKCEKQMRYCKLCARERKRELGDCAKLRDAVKAVVAVGYPHNFQHEAPHIRGYCYDITEAIKKCFDALAAAKEGGAK